MHPDDLSDKPKEECGIFGIYAPNQDVARMTFFGLYALQHRGQESAGIATSDGHSAFIYKEMGLVAQIFNEENLAPLKGHIGIGHTRYSTTGSSHIRNAAPYLIESIFGPLGVAHNGNLTNTMVLRHQLLKRGVGLSSTTDSEVITQMLAAPSEVWQAKDLQPEEIHADSQFSPSPLDPWQARLQAFMRVAQGAYSLAILTNNGIYGARDPLGLRPLCLGELPDGGYAIASESCALHTIGAKYLREIEPGEIIRINEHGISSITGVPSTKKALCVFEYVYFSRPDSMMEGQVVHKVRQRIGRQLAIESNIEADVVVGVPDSATPHAIGYSQASGIPYMEGLIKNRYIGRTFIQPGDQLRKVGVKLKYNPLTDNLAGKRVVLVDDSIVRGNTIAPLLQLLREGGATEVHVRVASPPIRHPCFMGVDMATYNELIAHRMKIAEICEQVGADSLAYLSVDGLMKAVQEGIETPNAGHCNACFSGNYPIEIPDWLFEEDRAKLNFEGIWG